jgi:hypothetical protein
MNNDATRWRLVIEYGEKDPEGRYLELGSVELWATEAVADEAARALLRVMQDVARRAGWERGVGIRMDRVALGPRRE